MPTTIQLTTTTPSAEEAGEEGMTEESSGWGIPN